MADIWFYQLLHQPLERALPMLLEKSIERGWRAVVHTSSDERLRALDDLLWTWSEESFLAHATPHDGDPAMQPVYLTTGRENPNGANIRFFVDGTQAEADDACERIILMFDGRDDDMLAQARAQWKTLKDEGRALSYWQQTESGGWEKKA